MNLLDAQLTVLWVRLEVATEGNALMARVLNYGELPFISLKLLIGAFASYVLYRCAHLPLARRGMTLVLTIYFGLMLIHFATGCAALGWRGPVTLVGFLGHLPQALAGLFS